MTRHGLRRGHYSHTGTYAAMCARTTVPYGNYTGKQPWTYRIPQARAEYASFGWATTYHATTTGGLQLCSADRWCDVGGGRACTCTAVLPPTTPGVHLRVVTSLRGCHCTRARCVRLPYEPPDSRVAIWTRNHDASRVCYHILWKA